MLKKMFTSEPRRRSMSCLVGTLLTLTLGAASAQDWPNRAVRLVVPYPAGGAVDIVARALAEKLSTALAQPVIVDNKAGAGGLIGADAVAKSAPDGYTIALVSNTISAVALKSPSNFRSRVTPSKIRSPACKG